MAEWRDPAALAGHPVGFRQAAILAAGVGGVSLSAPLIAGTAAPALAIAFWRTAGAAAALVLLIAVTRSAARSAQLTRLCGVHVPAGVWAGVFLALTGVVLLGGTDLRAPGAVGGDLLALAGGVFGAATSCSVNGPAAAWTRPATTFSPAPQLPVCSVSLAPCSSPPE